MQGDDGSKWQHRLTDSEITKLHLARAFIMNPEVMVLHRPFMYYPKNSLDHAYAHIMEAIIEHRDNRGYKMPHESVSERRPRTVFYTADTEDEEQLADQAWVLPDGPGALGRPNRE